jgi:hypothetical protein
VVYTPFAAGQPLTAGELNSQLVQETMAWTPLASVGSFASGFAAGSTPACRMHKMLVMGVEVWEFEGRITVTGTLTANVDTTCFTFNTGFRTGSERGFECVASASSFYPIRITFQSSGQLHIGVPTAAGSAITSFLLDGCRITNPLA